jgi:hypothetical protein
MKYFYSNPQKISENMKINKYNNLKITEYSIIKINNNLKISDKKKFHFIQYLLMKLLKSKSKIKNKKAQKLI